jgi:hypothetical protein
MARVLYDLSLIELYACKPGTWNEKVMEMMMIVLGLKSSTLRDCG